jgi:hypothetical protein
MATEMGAQVPAPIGVVTAAEEAGPIPGVAVVVIQVAVRTRIPPTAGHPVVLIAIDAIVEDVVVEPTIAREPLHQLGDFGLGIVAVVVDVESGVIPVAAGLDLIEAERVSGDGGEDHTITVATHNEGLPVAAPSDLVSSSSPNQVVLTGIDRIEDPEPTLGVVVQDQEIAVVTGLDLNPGSLAFAELSGVVDPEPDRRGGGSRRQGYLIGRPVDRNENAIAGERGQYRQPQWEDHLATSADH